MRILIAEDDRTSLSILSATLDWEMPGLDGAALCEKLRGQNRKTPLYLILLTAKKDTQDIVQGLEAGADDYMIKPYHHAELQARVNAGCRMIEIQNKMMEQEKLQGVLEMAGALCHELNQPLQVVSGLYEIILMDINAGDTHYQHLKTIKNQIDRIGKLTQKMMAITRYQSKPYLKRKIVDIDRASAG